MADRRPSWWLMLALCTPSSALATVLPDTLAQRLTACTACHAQTDQARGTDYFPRIGGKPAGYLYNQLTHFRDGRRQVPVMTNMVAHLPDAYLHEIATYFAALHPPAWPTAATLAGTPARASPALLERGRVLALQGDAARKVPACVACHGQALAGTLPAVPGLLGLPRDYVNAQLGAWRNRTRQALLPDCMALVAARLSPDDIHAVSTWLAAQPYSPAARPAASSAGPLPLACGSVP